MKRNLSRRWWLVGTALTMLASSSPSGASASVNRPTVFRSVTSALAAGDSYVVNCGIEDGHGEKAVFLAVVLTDVSSALVRGSFVFGGDPGGLVVEASVGGVHRRVYRRMQSETDHGNPYDFGTAHEEGMTLRVVWAGWNAHIACVTRINGTRVPSRRQPADKATLLWSSDLSRGAGINTSLGGVSVAGTYTRPARGFLIAVLNAPNGQGKIRHPNRTVDQGSFVFVSAKDPGSWNYSLDRQAQQGTALLGSNNPSLAIMELPE